MAYRNKTYIAADWTADKDAVDKLHEWNDSKHWGLEFYDAHELTSSRDSSKNCTIKESLDTRLDNSKAFVLIVGEHTKRLTKGKCFESCDNYSKCSYGELKKSYSYVQFECNGAKSRYEDTDLPRIIVLYKDTKIDKSKCLDSVKDIALAHAAMWKKDNDGKIYWDYQSVKKAFDEL